MAKIAVLGYGTVGSGVVKVIEENQALIAKRVGEPIEVKYILDLREFPGDPYEDKVVHDISVILEDPEVSVVCETMGGNEPAFTFSRKALSAGKSVCTSNKELVANHGPELLKTAKENHCSYLFEASVGGGIPIIRPINEDLACEDITGITGILNGTTNYILTKMDREGCDFAEVLKQAQDLGYAERNPEADVEGHDACRKIAILGSLMSGKYVLYSDIQTEGITKITAEDFAYAKEMNSTIKLLARASKSEDGFRAMVSPFLVSKDHPLAGVSMVFNSIYVESNMLGETMYYGKGAGKEATASAVVSDVIDAVRHQGSTTPCTWEDEKVELASMDDEVRSFFVRVPATEKANAQNAFAVAKEIAVDGMDEYAFVTAPMKEKDFAQAAEKVSVVARLRIFA